jgi:hypothetical protein
MGSTHLASVDRLVSAVMLRLFHGAKTGEYSAPKTVLGFYAIVLGILAAAGAAAIKFLAGEPDLHHLVAPILVFVGAVIVLILLGVFAVTLKDPTKLQLGQITGREYIEAQRLTLGDSNSGEFIETLPVLGGEATDATATGTRDLPKASEAEGELGHGA